MEAEEEEDFFGSASFSGGDIRTHIHMMEDNGNGKDERENTSMGNGHKETLVIKRSVEGERENGGEDNGGGGISRNIGGGGNEDDVLVRDVQFGEEDGEGTQTIIELVYEKDDARANIPLPSDADFGAFGAFEVTEADAAQRDVSPAVDVAATSEREAETESGTVGMPSSDFDTSFGAFEEEEASAAVSVGDAGGFDAFTDGGNGMSSAIEATQAEAAEAPSVVSPPQQLDDGGDDDFGDFGDFGDAPMHDADEGNFAGKTQQVGDHDAGDDDDDDFGDFDGAGASLPEPQAPPPPSYASASGEDSDSNILELPAAEFRVKVASMLRKSTSSILSARKHSKDGSIAGEAKHPGHDFADALFPITGAARLFGVAVDRTSITRPELALPAWFECSLSAMLASDLQLSRGDEHGGLNGVHVEGGVHVQDGSKAVSGGGDKLDNGILPAVPTGLSDSVDLDFFSGGMAVDTSAPVDVVDQSQTPSSCDAHVSGTFLEMFGGLDAMDDGVDGSQDPSDMNGGLQDKVVGVSLECLIEKLPAIDFMLSGTVHVACDSEKPHTNGSSITATVVPMVESTKRDEDAEIVLVDVHEDAAEDEFGFGAFS